VECPAVVSPGTPFSDWLRELDVIMVCEKLLPRVFAWARRQSVRVVYIPNLDWAGLSGSVERWVRQIRKSGCECGRRQHGGYGTRRGWCDRELVRGRSPIPCAVIAVCSKMVR
jgi:hypothetical protein